jgi:hypothetical protein
MSVPTANATNPPEGRQRASLWARRRAENAGAAGQAPAYQSARSARSQQAQEMRPPDQIAEAQRVARDRKPTK